ncbi:hypothetical protein [Demequina litorisediminis]|uniref:hypothetical protein n=1 Tax=Demequina litorisediminis TaxID=1849022 RepID=UPI0024E097AF|nr:hypothetical protein [Demequina litorisediminis]
MGAHVRRCRGGGGGACRMHGGRLPVSVAECCGFRDLDSRGDRERDFECAAEHHAVTVRQRLGVR